MLISFMFIITISAVIGIVSSAQTKDSGMGFVEGSIKEDEKTLKNSQVMISEKGKLHPIYIMTDANGSFKSKLSDGTYTVKAIKDRNNNWYSTSDTFIVKKGKIIGKGNQIAISAKNKEKKASKKSSNFKGKLKEGNKGLKADLILSRYSEDEEEIIRITSEDNGKFSAKLDDGNYFLFEVEVDGGFYRHELGFTVKDGIIFIDGKPHKRQLSITLPVHTYSGIVTDSTTGISGANIVLEKRISNDEYNTDFIQNVITDQTGSFSLRALTDGIYTLSVYHDTYYSWKHLSFEVIDGKIYRDGEETSSLQIMIPDMNVKGKVLEGTQPIPDTHVSIVRSGSDEYIWYNVRTDAEGHFQYRLEDGMYTIQGIDEPNGQTEMNIPFEIRDGKVLQNEEETSLLTIELPPVSLNGKLVESGNPLQGSIFIEKITDEFNQEGFNASTDENGTFSLRLKDGSYRVSSGYLYGDGEQISFNTTFEILNGQLVMDGQEQTLIELEVPSVSLHGLVKDGDRTVTNGMVSVTSQDQSVDIWKSINSDGSFAMRLTDGDYYVKSIQIEDGTTTELFQPFSIVDGKLSKDDQLLEVLEISAPPVTLTGTLTEEGTPVIGNFYIMEINDAETPLQYWGNTDDEGKFQFRMLDGDYKVYNVGFPDGSNFSPGTVFSIQSGQLYVNDELTDQLNIDVPPLNLSGHVVNGEESVDQGQLYISMLTGYNGAYVDIYNGFYQTRLRDGEYEILYVYDYQNGYFEMKKNFVISNGKPFVDDQAVSTLDINLQDLQ